MSLHHSLTPLDHQANITSSTPHPSTATTSIPRPHGPIIAPAPIHISHISEQVVISATPEPPVTVPDSLVFDALARVARMTTCTDDSTDTVAVLADACRSFLRNDQAAARATLLKLRPAAGAARRLPTTRPSMETDDIAKTPNAVSHTPLDGSPKPCSSSIDEEIVAIEKVSRELTEKMEKAKHLREQRSRVITFEDSE